MFPCADHVSLCVDASHILKRVPGEIYAFPVRYLPNPASAVNYVAMLWKGNFGRYMLNSFFSSAVAATCAVFIAILAVMS